MARRWLVAAYPAGALRESGRAACSVHRHGETQLGTCLEEWRRTDSRAGRLNRWHEPDDPSKRTVSVLLLFKRPVGTEAHSHLARPSRGEILAGTGDGSVGRRIPPQ